MAYIKIIRMLNNSSPRLNLILAMIKMDLFYHETLPANLSEFNYPHEISHLYIKKTVSRFFLIAQRYTGNQNNF